MGPEQTGDPHAIRNKLTVTWDLVLWAGPEEEDRPSFASETGAGSGRGDGHMTQALHRQAPGVLTSGCLTTRNHPYAPGLALARFPFAGHRVAPSGPFQHHRGTDPLPSQSLQASGRMAALWRCPTLGTSWVRQRGHSTSTATPGRSDIAQLPGDRMQLKEEAFTDQ